MKKRCFLLLALLVVLSAMVLPTRVWAEDAASGTCGEGLRWALDDGGVLTIFGSGDMASFAQEEIPWAAYREQILELVIESGVTGLSDGAFASCSNLTAIHFNGSVPSFGTDVFSGVTATAYYPAGNETWTEEVKLGYGGNLTWEAYCDHQWQDATCVAPKTCSLCGATDGEATGHNYEAVVTEPTCTEQGYTTHTCAGCGDAYQDTYTEPKGHSYEPVTVEPTCTEQGYIGQACACGDVIVESFIQAKDHSYEEVVTEPTCTEQGYTTHTCTVCADSFVDTYTDPKGHTYEAVTVGPTCTEYGYTGQACACGDVIVEAYTEEPLGHSYEDVTIEMTCTQDGFVGQVCAACGDTVTQETMPAPGHAEVVDKGVPPTCTEDGLTDGSHCSVCSEVLVEQTVIPAAGHQDATKDYICDVCRKDLCTTHRSKTIRGRAATCERTGLTDGKKCSKCGDILVAQEIIPALGHTWQAATCTTPQTCTVCAVTQGEVLEHSFGQWTEVKAPTTEETGLSQRVCDGCGLTEEKTLDKLEPPATEPPTEPTQPVQTDPIQTKPAPIVLPDDNRNPVLLIVAVACLAGSLAGIVVLLLGRRKE